MQICKWPSHVKQGYCPLVGFEIEESAVTERETRTFKNPIFEKSVLDKYKWNRKGVILAEYGDKFWVKFDEDTPLTFNRTSLRRAE